MCPNFCSEFAMLAIAWDFLCSAFCADRKYLCFPLELMNQGSGKIIHSSSALGLSQKKGVADWKEEEFLFANIYYPIPFIKRGPVSRLKSKLILSSDKWLWGSATLFWVFSTKRLIVAFWKSYFAENNWDFVNNAVQQGSCICQKSLLCSFP